MRGRTNITQRRQPTINGQVQQFVVESGNTIAKGDFVSVVLGNEITQVSANEIPKRKFVVDKTNGKYIVCSTSMAYLIQCVGEQLTILDSLSIVNNIVYHPTYDAVLNKFTLWNGSDWCEYTITNDEFVFVKNFTTFTCLKGSNERVEKGDVLAIVPLTDGYFFFFNADLTTTTSYKYLYCAITDMQVATRIYKTDPYSYQSLQNGCDIVKTENGNIFLLINTYYSKHYLYLYYFYINGANTTRTQIKGDYSSFSMGSDFFFNGSNTICFQNRYFYLDEGTVYKKLDLEIYHSASSSSSPFDTVSFIDDDKLLNIWGNTNDGNHFVVYELDEDLETFTEVQNNTDVSNEKSLGFFVKTTTGLYLMFKSPTNNYWGFRVLNYSNGVYQFGTATNRVRSYDGASAIGFAAGGGNAGATIPVYIPLSN